MAGHMLMKRGKRSVATYIKAECQRPCGQQQLSDLLDYLLDPKSSLDDFEKIDWCRWIIAGGVTYDEFAKTVRLYDNASTCGLVWTANFVAYRCRTCGISPCMSLCADCFQAGNHTGHDFNMFRSQAGGACDCGDTSVMKSCGFCPRHGPANARRQTGVPADLLVVADAMMPRLIWRLLQHLRDNSKPDMLDTYLIAMQDAERYLHFLHTLSDMGAAMRHVITKVVTNPHIYQNLLQGESSQSSGNAVDLEHSQANYLAALDTLRCPPIPPQFSDVVGLTSALSHGTLLEELLFWTVKFEFPQKIVTLLLSILPDDQYKEAFTCAFIQHYSRISIALVNSGDRQTICNRVVHISVQLLSPEALALQMTNDYQLLYIMAISLEYMLQQTLTQSAMNDELRKTHKVIDCSKDAMREHCYWPIVSDFINILSHKPVAFKFMSDSRLLHFWFEIISYFQGMNLNQRELTQHVEYEPDTYYAAFSAELEICSSPMWSMAVHCNNQETWHYTQTLISCVLEALQQWFDAIKMRPFSQPNRLQVSFHMPLHRYLAVFLSQAVKHQGKDLVQLLPSHDFLQLLMIHPLQIQVATHEIFCGMWVRNGLQIRGQAMTYIQCHFCNSMLDADLYLLQVCASRLDPDYFLRTFLDRFHVTDLLTVSSERTRIPLLQAEHEIPMLEGMLTSLISLLSVRTQIGMEEAELTRHEMVTLLCMADRTHSQLMDAMPEKCGLSGQSKNFEPTLKQVANYKAPNFEAGGGLQQGMYVPKGDIWENDYDPIYVMLRAVHRRDVQSAMDRYTAYVKQQGLYQGKGSPWPPFRLPGPLHPTYTALRRLLHCRTMHGIILTLLYKAVSETCLSDAVVYQCCHLLELAIECQMSQPSRKECYVPVPHQDKSFSQWFATDCIFTNAQSVITEVAIKVKVMEAEDSHEEPMDIPSPVPDDLFELAPSVLSGNYSLQVTSLLDQAILSLESTTMASTQTGARAGRQDVGVSANLDRQTQSKSVVINESILSLLFKLHAKLSGKQNSYVPESMRGRTSQDTLQKSRIGDGPFFIGKILDKFAQKSTKCGECIVDLYRSMSQQNQASTSRDGHVTDKEERRRRARERQQKLLADFASQQKQWAEQAFATATEGQASEEQEPDSSAETLIVTAEPTYDCVICNQTAPSTPANPFGLVALAQATSVLGHRRHTADCGSLRVHNNMSAPSSDNCGTETDQRLQLLMTHFEEKLALESQNIGWRGGVHVQTCGHYVHLECRTSYLASLRSQQLQSTLLVSKGEYMCPLCRQLANSVLPVLSKDNYHPPAGSEDDLEMAVKIRRLIGCKMLPVLSGDQTDAIAHTMSHMISVTHSKYKTYAKSNCSESVLCFLCSVARTNLELELLHQQMQPSQIAAAAATRRTTIVPLLHVLGVHSKVWSTDSTQALWTHITGLHSHEDCKSLVAHRQEVPILLKDMCCLLIQLLLTMPFSVHKAYFQVLVQSLYNVLYVQALAVMSCKFSSEERAAWQTSSMRQEVPAVSLQGMLGSISNMLSQTHLYDRSMADDPHVPASVECSVQECCISFLRLSALLQHHLYQDATPPQQGGAEEFKELCQYTGLCSREASISRFSGADCVRWLENNGNTVMRSWTLNLMEFIEKDRVMAKTLLLVNPVWHAPRLVCLPQEYDKIFQFYRRQQCQGCSSVPKDPALCLVCAQLLCFKDNCCRRHSVWECAQHAIDCGGGTGMFLVVNSSVIVVIRGPRATLWGSVYLDEHGEEDRDLKRGKPLYLSEERYKILEQQWIMHSFDHVCKRWIFHQDKL